MDGDALAQIPALGEILEAYLGTDHPDPGPGLDADAGGQGAAGGISSGIHLTRLKTGHIHGSWRLDTPQGAFFLQDLNTRVFQRPEAVMRNLTLVQQHLERRGPEADAMTPNLIPTRQGATHLRLGGSIWRMFEFREGRISHPLPRSGAMVREAGRVFGRFVRALDGLDPAQLEITIPSFHSLAERHRQLNQAAHDAGLQTAHDAGLHSRHDAGLHAVQMKQAGHRGPREISDPDIRDLLREADRLVKLLLPLERAAETGGIPIRITHNDAKLNNLLFNPDGTADCVVDLDTVMPGIIHYDIGDALRTLLPDRPEDDPDASGIRLHEQYQHDFLDGYAEGGWLTPQEHRWLPYAAPYMACIMGVRFLTDHLRGNRYFKTDYPSHNLVRAVNQLTLAGRLAATIRR